MLIIKDMVQGVAQALGLARPTGKRRAGVAK